MSKKNILILDNSVPAYDMSAGYRTADMYIDVFLDLGLNVTLFPLDFLKTEPYYSYYKNKSVEILAGEQFKKNHKKWIKENGKNIDFILLNTPRAIRYINLLKKYTNATIIYHGRDMHFVRLYELFKINKSFKSLFQSAIFYFIEKYLYKKSDVFLSVSLKEVKKIKEIVPEIKAYYHPVFYYKKFNEPIIDFSNRNNLLFVGAKHLPNIDAIKWFGNEIMPIVNKSNRDIKLIVVGNLPENLQEQIKNNSIIFTGKISEEKLEKLYKNVKLVVIPLRFGAGVKGKTIEAMYYGLPIVATSFALEGLPGNVEKIIKPIDNANDFANKVLEIYNDDEYNYEISKNFNEYIKKYFSYEQALSVIKNILNI